jgi:hypothetical protein
LSTPSLVGFSKIVSTRVFTNRSELKLFFISESSGEVTPSPQEEVLESSVLLATTLRRKPDILSSVSLREAMWLVMLVRITGL